jgi:hypothetical protein
MVTVVAVIVWLFADRVLAWALPSSEWAALVPALAGAFLGVMWARLLAGDPTPLSDGIGAVVGAFVVLYLAITVGTPGQAGAVINCVAMGPLETSFKTRYPGPWAWPYQMVVTNRGSVVWHVHASRALNVTIRFPHGSPFEQASFSASIASGERGVILAAPVVKAGPFEYEITCTDAEGNVFTVDPKVKIPRGRRGGP